MEEIRIGVFVCNCGSNIAGFLDCKELAEYSKTLPDVTFTRENLFSCSEAGVTDIKNAIIENKLNRVIVAACTPRTHEPTFRAACQDAGMNPFFFEFVNIREHCSWAHKNEPEPATQKAKDLIRMGVARARLLEPQESIVAKVEPSALIIGGGIAGLTATQSLAARGFEVTLVERTNQLGGLMKGLYQIFPGDISAEQLTSEKIETLSKYPNANVMTETNVVDVAGYVGNYVATIQPNKKQEIKKKFGIIIVATGTRSLIPDGLYKYDGKKIITQMHLESLLKTGKFKTKNVVMIQCAGSRNSERIYCSRICCMTAIKSGIFIKQQNPDAKVFILYRDLMCHGVENEEILRRAKELGVRFVKFSEDQPPQVEENSVKVFNDVLGREMEIDYDSVVLATPLIPNEGVESVSKMLKVPLDEYKFFLEAHIKLRPNDFATDGIYVCGTAHWPATITESIHQALGAAARASIHLTREEVEVEPIVSMLVDEDACRGCGLCASVCPYGSIEMVQTSKGIKANIVAVACKGCGTCGATCYKHAIKMNHFTNEQLTAQISVAFNE
ncbi:CoB--CoM heterodisulfide reductase iron-sulfur subunit A family protein [candidate division KSB1 bacterium]|nr:CoB--CoM heterodisulfide reductase iron-sulfur subunit A family protein [candidate division KSB1 bacterium]MBL7093307.1 CoB--CoM heterodisulfide reductase iron-sulfur subunit A family protein [candidate division KSB1 bacterium]